MKIPSSLLFVFFITTIPSLRAQRNLLPIYNEVQQLLQYDDFHSAEKAIRNARKRYSKNDTVEALWGRLQYLENDTSRALNIWNNALKNDPKSIVLNEQLIQYYANRRDCKRALNYVDKILKEKNPPVRFFYIKGLFLHDMSDIQGAKRYFERAITFKEGALGNYYLAIMYINEKDYSTALKFLNFGLKEYPEMGEMYLYRGLCNNELGDSLTAEEDWEKAGEFGYKLALLNVINGCAITSMGIDTNILRQYLSIEQKMGVKSMPLLQLEYSSHMASHQYKAASITLSKMMKLSPDNDNLHITKGVLFLTLDSYDSAMVCFKKSTEINHNNKNGYYHQALCYLQMEHFDSALSYVSYLFTNYPAYAEAYGLAGDILVQQKKYADAYKLYSKAISVDEEFAEGYFKRSLMREGYYEFGALSDLAKAIYLAPDRVEYRLRRADLYMEMSKGRNAYKDLKFIRANFPYDSRGIFAMARYYTSSKDYKLAIKEYDRGFKLLRRLNPDSSLLMKQSILLRLQRLFPHGGLKEYDYVSEQAEIVIKDIEKEQHDVYRLLMYFYYSIKGWEEALKYAELHRKITPVEKIDKNYFYTRARIKYFLEDINGCCSDFEKAGYLDTHGPPYYCPR